MIKPWTARRKFGSRRLSSLRVNDLSQISYEISNSMNEMSVGTEQIDGAINNVNNISQNNKDSIENLVKAISLFKN